jgi:hypothetical protein
MSTTTTTTIEKFLWVCELNKECPSKKWNPNDYAESEEKDSGIVISTLVLNSALLGSKAVEGERNLVCLKTKGVNNMDIDNHPIICLTLGRNDLVNNFDLTLSSKEEVEFKLAEGTGPVYITCSHVSEIQYTDDLETIMTDGSETDKAEQDIEDADEELKEEEEAAEQESEEKETNGKASGKAKPAVNGKHAVIKNGKTNGHANGHSEAAEVEIEEKPGKRKRQ